MRGRLLAAGAVLSAAGLLVAGCGGVEGSPVAASPVEVFEPCSIPADAIEATGLDPKIFDNGWGEGIVADGWTRCLWEGAGRPPSYLFEILASSERAAADLYSNSSYSDITEIDVAGHTWLEYRITSRPRDVQCGLAFDTVKGMVTVEVTLEDGPTADINPCQKVLEHATDLVGHFPAQK